LIIFDHFFIFKFGVTRAITHASATRQCQLDGRIAAQSNNQWMIGLEGEANNLQPTTFTSPSSDPEFRFVWIESATAEGKSINY
jgi:hypothetical protein